jgi:hypothetical protein
LHSGRTYTLNQTDGTSSSYYQLVRELADSFLEMMPGEAALLKTVRNASAWRGLLPYFRRPGGRVRRILLALESALVPFLGGVEEHLGTLSLADRLDRTIRTSKEQYLFYMLEIELTNRLNRASFSKAPWRMALIAHCLRDFRGGCRSRLGEIEEVCMHCDRDCYVNKGAEILDRYQVHPFISMSMDHGGLFRKLKAAHPDMGVLGIACIPELVAGLRLCGKLGIPAVGVPLDANRCSRWLGECLETTFSLEEMERLVKAVPGA